VKSSNREMLFALADMVVQPGVRDARHLREHCTHAVRRDHLEPQAVTFTAPLDIAQARPAAAIQRKSRQANPRFLAELDNAQPGIEVKGQARSRDVIKRGVAAMPAG